MEGKLIKSPNGEHYYLTVDGKIFAEIGGHPLKSINQALSIKNCETVANGYDLDELIKKEIVDGRLHPNDGAKKEGIARGFGLALEILGDKKFSEEDILDAWEDGATNNHPLTKSKKENLLKSLQQTEWDVEIEMDFAIYLANLPKDGEERPAMKPKLDSDGCLILKRK